MKDKKGFIIGIIIVAIVGFIGVFLGIKMYYLNKYNHNTTDELYQEIRDGLNITNTITIETKNLNESEYLTFNNIKIRNDFENFEILISSDKSITYGLNVNDKLKAVFWIDHTTYSLVYQLSNESELYGWNGEYLELNIEERREIFKNYGIENDTDLISFFTTYEYQKNNIFTSTKKMKENYFIKFITCLLSRSESVTRINGDYEGYILNKDEEIEEAYIFKNNKKYKFIFMSNDYFTDDYFTDEYINDLLNTIVIEDY